MRGQLPSKPSSAKKTSLLISWLPVDAGLLDALRPFKARARGRRIKELAVLGAEVEKLGFRIDQVDGRYRVLGPALQQTVGSAAAATSPAPLASTGVMTDPIDAHPAADVATHKPQGPEILGPPPPDPDASDFAKSFI
nr:hypothetical protein [Stenotrophomonas pavanii]